MSALEILTSLPISEVIDLVDELLEEGVDRDDALDSVVEFLDRLLAFGVWIPGPAGMAIETIDGPVLRAALDLVFAFAANPRSRANRRARRDNRRANRARRRAARRSEGSES